MFDPRTITHVNSEVKLFVLGLAENYKFERAGLHTLVYEYERDNHRGDEYIDTVCVSIILTRRFDGYYLTYKRSHETDYDCTYTHYIYEEKLDLIPYERNILKEAFKGKPMEEYERRLI